MDDSPGRIRVRLDSVNRISDRLLQGWTLLSDGCPECGVPLLRKAPSPETWCVNCEASYLDGQRVMPANHGPDAGASQWQQLAQQEQQRAEQSSSGGSGVAADDPTSDPRLGPFARHGPAPVPTSSGQTATPSLGRAGLSSGGQQAASFGGPRAAAAHPQRAPALDSPPLAVGLSLEPTATAAGPQPQPRPVNGLAAGERMHDSEDDEAQHAHGMNGGLVNGDVHSSAGHGSGTADAARRRAESDRISAALGQKMLQGWALLDVYCPMCNTPLVRSRDGRLFCVGCDMDVVRDGGRNTAGPSSGTAGAPAAAAADTGQSAAAGASTARAAAAATAGPAGDAATAAARQQTYEAAGATHNIGQQPPAAAATPAAAMPPSAWLRAADSPQPMQQSPQAFEAAAARGPDSLPQGGQLLESPNEPQEADQWQQGTTPPEPQDFQQMLRQQRQMLDSLMQHGQQHRHAPQPLQEAVQGRAQPPQLQPLQRQGPWQGPWQGSPKRGTDDRSPPSGSLTGSDRRKRERTSGPQDLEAPLADEPMAAVPDWPGRPDSASAAMVAANAVPQLSPPAPAATARVAPPAADAAVRSPGAAAGPPGPAALYHGSGADPAAAIIGAARHTLLTKMHETQQQLAATPSSDVEGLSRLTVLLGQQADALAALRRSL